MLGPLGLTRTGYEATEFDPGTAGPRVPAGRRALARAGARSARRLRADGRHLQLRARPGPLGRRLRRRVPALGAGPAADARHPLSRASRREMQLAQVAITERAAARWRSSPGRASISYGFGLFAEDDPAFGTIVQHSGGYPGYGSQMRWHPATGLGTVVLANSTYAHAGALAGELLSALLTAQAGRAGNGVVTGCAARSRRAARGRRRWRPATRSTTCCRTGTMTRRARIFTPNVDSGPAARAAAGGRSRRCATGSGRSPPTRPAGRVRLARALPLVADRPGGTVAVQIKLAPLRQPLVQQLIVARAAGRRVGAGRRAGRSSSDAGQRSGATDWPAGLATAARLRRRPSAARAAHGGRAGPGRAQIDCYLAGNGSTSTTVRLVRPDRQGRPRRGDQRAQASSCADQTSRCVRLGGSPRRSAGRLEDDDRDLPGRSSARTRRSRGTPPSARSRSARARRRRPRALSAPGSASRSRPSRAGWRPGCDTSPGWSARPPWRRTPRSRRRPAGTSSGSRAPGRSWRRWCAAAAAARPRTGRRPCRRSRGTPR